MNQAEARELANEINRHPGWSAQAEEQPFANRDNHDWWVKANHDSMPIAQGRPRPIELISSREEWEKARTKWGEIGGGDSTRLPTSVRDAGRRNNIAELEESNTPDRDVESVADPLDVSDSALGDGMAAGIQAVVSAIPVVGGPLAVAIDYERQRYVSEKQAAFRDAVASELRRLGKTVGDLSRSFYGTMTYAAWLATLTNEKEKIDAFKTAVVNTALPNAPDEEMRELFLSMATTLTARHLRLLNCLFHPREYGIDAVNSADFHVVGGGMGGAFRVIRQHVPGFERRDILERCINDLVNQGLVYYQGQAQDQEARLLGNPLPTTLAHDFMAFINPPEELSHADPVEDQEG